MREDLKRQGNEFGLLYLAGGVLSEDSDGVGRNQGEQGL